MPVACANATALTGSSGAVYFAPAGTSVCLLSTDFTVADPGTIATGGDKDFREGDPVVFTAEGGATLATGLLVDTPYFIASVTAGGVVTVSATLGGAEIEITALGADNGGHINMKFDPVQAICQVRDFDCELTRETLNTTTLPCGVSASAGAQKWAVLDETQPGKGTVTGNVTLYFTTDQTALSNRLASSTFLNIQEGARMTLYISAISDGADPPAPVSSTSLYIDGEVVFMGANFAVNTDDPSTVSVPFQYNKITHWLDSDVS